MKSKILIIEDDENLGFIIQDNLKERNFETVWVKDGALAQKEFLKFMPNLCIIDIMLPNKDGFEIAKDIRATNQEVPILFLTARDLVEDRLKGFKSGGDDYITKPFSMQELLYRIDVFIKRRGQNNSPNISFKQYEYKGLKIEFSKNKMTFENQQKQLTDKELQLVSLLIQSKDRVLKREEILIQIWGDDDYFLGRSLDVFISKLRKFLKTSCVSIKNYHGIGFKWEEA